MGNGWISVMIMPSFANLFAEYLNKLQTVEQTAELWTMWRNCNGNDEQVPAVSIKHKSYSRHWLEQYLSQLSNLCCTEFTPGKIKHTAYRWISARLQKLELLQSCTNPSIYSHFQPFINIEIMQVVEMLPHGSQAHVYPARLINAKFVDGLLLTWFQKLSDTQ